MIAAFRLAGWRGKLNPGHCVLEMRHSTDRISIAEIKTYIKTVESANLLRANKLLLPIILALLDVNVGFGLQQTLAVDFVLSNILGYSLFF